MSLLTERQAFRVMIRFLEQYYERGKSDDIAVLLGSLSSVWGDDLPGDPAHWSDWLECVHEILRK